MRLQLFVQCAYQYKQDTSRNLSCTCNRFWNVLRVFACKELPLCSSPTSSLDRHRFHATNGCHGLQTPPQSLLIACIHNKQEVHLLLSQQLPEVQLAERIRLRKNEWASRAFTSTTAMIKVNILILQSLVVTLSSNDIGEWQAFLWSSSWCLNLKWLKRVRCKQKSHFCESSLDERCFVASILHQLFAALHMLPSTSYHNPPRSNRRPWIWCRPKCLGG